MTKAQREYQRAWRKKHPGYRKKCYEKQKAGRNKWMTILGVRCRVGGQL